MKNTMKLIVFSFLLLMCFLIIFAAQGFPQEQDTLQIDSAEVVQYKKGNYRIFIFLNQKRPADSADVDTNFENRLKDPNNYILKEKDTDKKIELPAEIELSTIAGFYKITLNDINITHKEKYTIEFQKPLPDISPKELTFRKGQGTDEWEKDKGMPWQNSIKPKISQGDSTIRELGDIGFELSLFKKLPKRLEFDFVASVTANKDDPSNHWTLNLFWKSNLLRYKRIRIRPLILGLQEKATQDLLLHDLSVSVFTSLSVHPFDGIQPIFMTVGWEQPKRVLRHGIAFDDPRFHLQVQWGFVGLVGRGSSFFVNYQYLRRPENIKHLKTDPSIEKENELIQLEFTLPIAENKNITVRYADGDVAPTFTKDTSVHIGLEFLFGGYRVLMPK